MRKFTKQTSPGGKDIYEDVEAGEQRLQLIEDFKLGKITQEEMRRKAKKIKYLYFEKDLPNDFELV